MARKNAVLVSVDLAMSPEQISAVVESVPGEGTQSSKVAAVALGLVENLVEGGMMLSRETVRRLEDAAGKQVSEGDLIELVEAGQGKQGGSRVVTLPIDPVHVPALEEVARSSGMPSAEALMRRDIEDLWDQGHFYSAVPQPRRVLMSENDYSELRGMLGKDFDNGTELKAMVVKYATESAGLFPVGRE